MNNYFTCKTCKEKISRDASTCLKCGDSDPFLFKKINELEIENGIRIKSFKDKRITEIIIAGFWAFVFFYWNGGKWWVIVLGIICILYGLWELLKYLTCSGDSYELRKTREQQKELLE